MLSEFLLSAGLGKGTSIIKGPLIRNVPPQTHSDQCVLHLWKLYLEA